MATDGRIYFFPNEAEQVAWNKPDKTEDGTNAHEWIEKRLNDVWEERRAPTTRPNRLEKLFFDRNYWQQRRYRKDEGFKQTIRVIMDNCKGIPHPNHWVPEGLGALDSEAVKLLSSVGSGKCQQIEWFPNGLPCVRYSSTEFPDTLRIDGLAMEALLFAKLGQAPSKLVCCFGNLLIENYTLPEYDDMLAVFGKPPEQAADLMTGIPISKFEIEHSHAGVLTADGNLEMFGRLEGADGRAPRGPPAEESSQMKIDAADESNMQKNRDEGASRSPSFVPAHDTNRVEAVMCDSIPESSTNRLTPIQPIPQADRDEPAHPNAIPGGREPDKGTAQEGVVQDEVIAMPPPHLASGEAKEVPLSALSDDAVMNKISQELEITSDDLRNDGPR